MNIKDLICKKRDGGEHTTEELKELLYGYLDGEIQDYHMAAWLMAVFLKGMTVRETREWTRLMWHSGRTFPRSRNNMDYWVDKHSTGGVGDKTSLILVPLVISVCRRVLGEGKVRIPMVSGRALGHSGGTLDKLESVPGFKTDISFDRASDLLQKNGFLMMGQTEDMAPADRLIYALRDVTGTVESLPLIVSSIMSKKLSENLNGIVFDVKSGAGAFMKNERQARQLAEALIDVSKTNGLSAAAVLTRMDEPLGNSVGHQLEVGECADFLEGHTRELGLLEVTRTLAGWMVFLAARGRLSIDDAKSECETELATLRPFELFKVMFETQGGRWSVFEKLREKFSQEVKHFKWTARSAGWVNEIQALEFGRLLGYLGGGRDSKDMKLDLEVGIRFEKKVGDYVYKGDLIAEVFYKDSQHEKEIEKVLSQSILMSVESVKRQDWVLGICYEE